MRNQGFQGWEFHPTATEPRQRVSLHGGCSRPSSLKELGREDAWDGHLSSPPIIDSPRRRGPDVEDPMGDMTHHQLRQHQTAYRLYPFCSALQTGRLQVVVFHMCSSLSSQASVDPHWDRSFSRDDDSMGSVGRHARRGARGACVLDSKETNRG